MSVPISREQLLDLVPQMSSEEKRILRDALPEAPAGLDPPRNVDWPFFAYGIFRPGELAFFQLNDLVSQVMERAAVKGTLLLRDGLPIIDPNRDGSVTGALIRFRPGDAETAYERISAMEPRKLYRWYPDYKIGGEPVNALVGVSPSKGSHRPEEHWSSWKDPLFTDALAVVDETLKSATKPSMVDLKPLFRMQMAYLLLWSGIERYASLRYHLGGAVMSKIKQIAKEPQFAQSLDERVKQQRTVFRADDPAKSEVLDPTRPERSIMYYYQVRSNMTHRGKAALEDQRHVRSSLEELLAIFRDVLVAAKRDAGWQNPDAREPCS